MTMPNIPSMTQPPALEYLAEIGHGWTGQGCAVECGCWLGASTVSLLTGLVAAGYNRPLHCYDGWTPNADEVLKARAQGVEIKPLEDLRPMFLDNVRPIYRNVLAHRGRIEAATWIGEPIEIFIIDAAKQHVVEVLAEFGPSFIPGVTVIGMMDFNFWRSQPEHRRERYTCQPMFAQRFADRLELLRDFVPHDPAFFRYANRIDWRVEL